MNFILHLLMVVICFLLSPFYYTFSPFYTAITQAVAVVHPTKGNTMQGKVTFTQEKNGVRVVGTFTGLTPGSHGFHIHEFGDCGCDDAVCAGGHFNPTGQPHGSRTSPKRHVGDFGNIVADEQGQASVDFIDPYLALNGKNSILGRSVIIHAQEDDLTTQPSGNAGARIGCGNIGIGK